MSTPKAYTRPKRLETRIGEIFRAIKAAGIPPDDLTIVSFLVIGQSAAQDITNDELERLIRLLKALQDGEHDH